MVWFAVASPYQTAPACADKIGLERVQRCLPRRLGYPRQSPSSVSGCHMVSAYCSFPELSEYRSTNGLTNPYQIAIKGRLD